MRLVLTVVLYTALALGANTAYAQNPSYAEISANLTGDMKKLNFHSEPQDISDKAFIDEEGRESNFAAYEGKYVLVNFWATWCAPCRKEMPSLSKLQQEMQSETFEVVTLATGRNSTAAIADFFETINVINLPKFQDPKQKIARDMGILGLPMTVILSPEGKEIARLRGDADWASPEAIAVISALTSQ